MRITYFTLVTLLMWAGTFVYAGDINPSNAPGTTMHTIEDIYRLLTSSIADTKIGLNNTNTPAPTMHTLEEVYQLVAAVMSTNGGTPVGILRSGQTTSYATGDDGDLEKGIAWPNPVFTVGSGSASNCVTDNRTGLMWVRNPSSTQRTWNDALTYCNALDDAETYRALGGYTDWRMPNPRELLSLFDYSTPDGSNGLLPAGHPFEGTALGSDVWTSTTLPWNTGRVWSVFMPESFLSIPLKSELKYVWAVRGGN